MSAFHRRCVIASICEPKVLSNDKAINLAFEALTSSTEYFNNVEGKLSEQEMVLRKALGYAWSVAIVSDPVNGQRLFSKYLTSKDKHIQWIMKNNLKKNRLVKLDADWVNTVLVRFD